MKKYMLVLIVLLGACWSCQKDLDLYSGRDFIYFAASDGKDSTYFSFAYVDINKAVDSIYVLLRTGGNVTEYDRQVKVRIAETNGVEGIDYKALSPSYVVASGNTFSTILVELLRPEALKKEERYMILELEESKDFTLQYPVVGSSTDKTKEFSTLRYKIVFSEIMTAPKLWSVYEFGIFSVKKLDFICQEMNLTRDMFNDASYMINSRQKYISAKMVKILNDYSASGQTVFEDDNITPMRMGDVYYK